MSAYQQPTLTKLDGLPAVVKRVLLLNDEPLAVNLRRDLFPDTAVVHADIEQLGHPLYRQAIAAKCGDLPVLAPLDLIRAYQGDTFSGLQGLLGARLTSLPVKMMDLQAQDSHLGLSALLDAKDKQVAADDAEFNRRLQEQREAEASSVKGLTGLQPPPKPADRVGISCKPPELTDINTLTAKAQPVTDSDDPLELVKKAIKSMGYGGKVETTIIIYLAVTSRLLTMRRGSMPVHLLVKGQASGGKSYAVKIVTSLLPRSAVFEIDASSPRVLIYTDAEFKHKVTIFSEADSLPAGEDNPAASAIRNLLQDHRLHYDTVEAKGSRQEVRQIRKEGPTVLITTATRNLGHQLMTRLFVLDIPDDQNQIRAALSAQANLELHGGIEPCEELIAFQELLQCQAPFDVMVPFADKLAEAIGRRPQAARINRDYARLLSLIKAVAVLRNPRRQRDNTGKIVADIADYETVYELVSDMFEASVTGASETVREIVGAVGELTGLGKETVTVTDLANQLRISKPAASGRARKAIAGGWLVNLEDRPRRPFKLVTGDPLPDGAGLPSPAELLTCKPPVKPLLSQECNDLQGCKAVNPETADGRETIAEPEQPALSFEEELEGMRI